MNPAGEKEKFDFWTAFLKMENAFVDEKHLLEVFERALEANNPKRVFFKMLELFHREKRTDLLLELAKKMLKKHKISVKPG